MRRRNSEGVSSISWAELPNEEKKLRRGIFDIMGRIAE
jgi:hypothetical protein